MRFQSAMPCNAKDETLICGDGSLVCHHMLSTDRQPETRRAATEPTPYNENNPGPRGVGAWMVGGSHDLTAAANRRPVL